MRCDIQSAPLVSIERGSEGSATLMFVPGPDPYRGLMALASPEYTGVVRRFARQVPESCLTGTANISPSGVSVCFFRPSFANALFFHL